MKLKQIHFEPVAMVCFSNDDALILKRCSATHYDGRCKAAGQQGGIIFGIANVVLHMDGMRSLKWGEIDLLCKVLECPPPGLTGAERLAAKLWRVLNTMKEVRPAAQDFTKTDLYG